MNIGENISNLRKAKNMTQEELAKKINVSYKTVSSWERNRNIPSVDMLLLICDALDTDINTILDINKENVITKSEILKNKNFREQLIKLLLTSIIFIIPILYFWYAADMTLRFLALDIMKNLDILEENVDIICLTQQVRGEFLEIFILPYIIYLGLFFINYILYKLKKLNIILVLNTIILAILASVNFGWLILFLPVVLIIEIILIALKQSQKLFWFNIIVDLVMSILYLISLCTYSFDYIDSIIYLFASIVGIYWAFKIKE